MTTLAEARENNMLPKIGIAAAILALIGVCVFLFNPHKVATLSVSRVDTFAPELGAKPTAPEVPDDGIHVIDEPKPAAESDLYVIVSPKLTDDLRLPLFLSDFVLTVTEPDGSQTEARAIDAHDLSRLVQIFPALQPRIAHPIQVDDEVGPGQTAEGDLVFQIPQADAHLWTGRKTATLTVELRNQDPQTITLPK